MRVEEASPWDVEKPLKPHIPLYRCINETQENLRSQAVTSSFLEFHLFIGRAECAVSAAFQHPKDSLLQRADLWRVWFEIQANRKCLEHISVVLVTRQRLRRQRHVPHFLVFHFQACEPGFEGVGREVCSPD